MGCGFPRAGASSRRRAARFGREQATSSRQHASERGDLDARRAKKSSYLGLVNDTVSGKNDIFARTEDKESRLVKVGLRVGLRIRRESG